MKALKKKNIGLLYINCSLKNTIFNLTNEKYKSYKQWSTKSLKKKNNLKKNSPFNIHFLTYKIKKYLFLKKIKYLKIFIKGKGLGRYNFNRNLKKKIKILFIYDKTNLPFNGCRPKKLKRR
jgi:small subunit ribosomal protein S11